MQLVREVHRRKTRYYSRPAHWTDLTRAQVNGELLGLRVALGMELGHEAASADVVPAAAAFYERWVAEGMPEVMPA